MRKLTLLLATVMFAVASGGAYSAEPVKKPASTQAQKKSDPKWKNNSLAKKQAECKANPELDKCKKKTCYQARTCQEAASQKEGLTDACVC